MDIKKEIGSRISETRKQRQLTIKELAARTKTLSAARISNWEQGTRSPGPVEAKLIAKVLEVAPSYILCLSDNPSGELYTNDNLPARVPVLTLKGQDLSKTTITKLIHTHDGNTVTLEGPSRQSASDSVFAITIDDNSMQPDFPINSLVFIDPNRPPKPGQYVLAYVKSQQTTVLRKYRENNQSTSGNLEFELCASNKDWATIQVQNAKDAKILGVVIECRRYFS